MTLQFRHVNVDAPPYSGHMKTPASEPHLTVLETAAVLGVHPRTVWRYLHAGQLTAVRHPMNRRVYVRRSEVLAAREERHTRLEAPRAENAG